MITLQIQRRFFLAMLVLFVGCSQPLRQPISATNEVLQPDVTEVPVPVTHLNSALLYDILVAAIASQRGDHALAAQYYYKAAVETGEPQLADNAAQLALASRNLDLAMKASALWIDLSPDNTNAHQYRAVLLAHNRQIAAAMEHLDRILQLEKPEDAYQIIITLLSRNLDKATSLMMMAELVERHPDDIEASYAQAQLAKTYGEYAQANAILDQLLQRSPTMARALLLSAQVLYALGQRDVALTRLASALASNPDDNNIRLTYARQLIEERRYAEARKEFQELERRRPNNGDILYALGLLAMESRQLEQAEQYFLRLIEINTRLNEANYSLGKIAEERGQFDKAIALFQQVDEGDHAIEAGIRIAYIYERQDILREARDMLRALRERFPENGVRFTLVEANIMIQRGELNEARSIYDNGLQNYPGNTELLYKRAILFEMKGELALMEEDFRTILSKQPDDARTLNAFGYTLTERTDRHQEALQYIRRAIQLAPDDPAVIDSMGWVLYRLGHLEESLDHLRRAADMSEDSEIFVHLGEVLWVSGEHDEARLIWQRAKRLDPGSKKLQEVFERFKP